MTYDKPPANTWIQAQRKGHRIGCCDCGLIHIVDFRIRNGQIEFMVKRDNRATGQKRRYLKNNL